jgi:toxin ParE1/3/4
MKKALSLTDKARQDLRNIRRHIERDSPQQARKFARELASKLVWIAEVDFSGSPRDHLSEGLRGLPYKNRCIYFRSFEDRVVIIRVLHGAQDVEAQLFGTAETGGK